MSDTITQPEEAATLLIPPGMQVEIKEVKRTRVFQPIQKLCTKRSKGAFMDIFDYLNIVSKPARALFTLVKCEMDYETNIATLPKPKTPTETVSRSKAFKELQKYKIMKRVKPHVFMLNPRLIQPWNDIAYRNAETFWNNLK